jgi:hypothetical protein
MGVYGFVSEAIEPLEVVLEHELAFFEACTDSAIKAGEWPIIGEDPFPDEESSWGPPRAFGVCKGLKIQPRIVHKDKVRSASMDELIGLGTNTFSQRPELFVHILVKRLIEGRHDDYRVAADWAAYGVYGEGD